MISISLTGKKTFLRCFFFFQESITFVSSIILGSLSGEKPSRTGILSPSVWFFVVLVPVHTCPWGQNDICIYQTHTLPSMAFAEEVVWLHHGGKAGSMKVVLSFTELLENLDH